MADFHQNGVISTLHNFSHRTLEDIENEFDKTNNDWVKSNPSIEGFNLNNFLIMRNWIAYARKIGDKSVNKITHEEIKGSKEIRNLNRNFIY